MIQGLQIFEVAYQDTQLALYREAKPNTCTGVNFAEGI